MEKYKVISLAISGRNNKIYRSGDLVTAKMFPEGRLQELEKQGHLKLIDADQPPIDSDQKPSDDQPQIDNVDDFNITPDPGEGQPSVTDRAEDTTADQPPIDDVSRETETIETIDTVKHNELKQRLKALGVEFEKDATKNDLWQLWLLNKA